MLLNIVENEKKNNTTHQAYKTTYYVEKIFYL